MKKILLLLTGIITIIYSIPATAQSAGANGLDKSFFELLKKVEQDPSNKKALRSLSSFYNDAEQSHLQNIQNLQSAAGNLNYGRIINEYTALQNLFEVVEALPAASQAVNATDYSSQIQKTRQQGAADAYDKGMAYLNSDNSRLAKAKAYTCFKNAAELEPGYKDSQEKMNQLWSASYLNIQLNIVKSNNLPDNKRAMGDDRRDAFYEKLQDQIAADLMEQYGAKHNARFFTAATSLAENIQPDFVVDITLADLYITGPQVAITNTDYRSTEIVGKDKKGNDIVSPVYGTVDHEMESYTAKGRLAVTIKEITTSRTVATVPLKIQCTWAKNSYFGSGDRRLLQMRGNDPGDINKAMYTPTGDDLAMHNVYQNIYPDIQKVLVEAISK